MRYLKYLAVLGFCLMAVPAAHAQVVVGVGPAPVLAGPPVCAYGYYPYYPYACAPYGYYGPDWFVGGVFIGAGPWYHGFHGPFVGRTGFGGHGFVGRPGFAGRGAVAGSGAGFRGGAVTRGPVASGGRSFAGGGARSFTGGGARSFAGGGARSFGGGSRGGAVHAGGGFHGGGRR